MISRFRHSGAKNIEVELEDGLHELRILIRDDGSGIDRHVLDSGRDGHWGLSGMRERAERIGARLKVWSRLACGTEVDLRVPGRVAFEASISGHELSGYHGGTRKSKNEQKQKGKKGRVDG